MMRRTTNRERILIDDNNRLQVERWNLEYGIGQAVRFWTGLREGEGKTGKTTYKACVLGGHTPGVYILRDDGKNVGFVAFTHVEPIR
jgi:hypothetical protein